MKTQLLQSYSPENTITVGVAFGDIQDFRVPPSQVSGGVIDAAVGVRNTGDTATSFFIAYHRTETDWSQTFLKNSETKVIQPNEFVWFYDTIDTMPNRDNVVYVARSYRQGSTDADDWAEKTVELLTQVATTLTLAISPTKVPVGGSYKYTGKLTRNDSGAGIPTASILLERLEGAVWTSVGSVNTDASGNYASGNIAAPSTVGSFKVRSEYIGSAIFGGTLAYGSLGVGALAAVNLAPPMVLGIAAGGVTFIATRSGRKSVALGAMGFLAGLGYSYLTQPQTVARRT